MSILVVGYTSEEIDGKVVIRNTEGGSIASNDPRELLAFMAHNYGDERAINRKITWDLDEFMSIILRRFGVPLCEVLVQEPSCEAYFTYDADGEIEFHDIAEIPADKKLPAEYFSLYYYRQNHVGLQHGRQYKSYIYHLKQYFDRDIEINKPEDLLPPMQEFTDACFGIGLRPMLMGSAISLYEDNVLKHMDIPTISDIDNSLSEDDVDTLLAWCDELIKRGDWTTNLAIGHWREGESFDYDVSSCYAHHLSRLSSIKNAKFFKSTEPCKTADEGIMQGVITINPDVRVSPISCRHNGQIIYPTGCSWEDIITLGQVRWMYRHKIGTFKLNEGIFWTYPASPVKPFAVPLSRIFNKRSEGGMVEMLCKRINASCWGKLIQKHSRTGYIPFKNPIMALQVKTAATLQVADFIFDNHLSDSVIHIATDGVRTEKQVDGIPKSAPMGKWRFTGDEACIITTPGGIMTPTKKPTGLYYQDIINMIEACPDETYYSSTINRRITLGEALLNEALDKVGEYTDFNTSFDLNSNRAKQDYEFDDMPQTGGDLLSKKYYGTPISTKKV